MVNIQDRVELDGAYGTIRWIGHLPQWGPATLAYGIEWDDPQRGKNSGSVGDTFYFSVQVPLSGSFVKASNKKLRLGRAFVDALWETYCGEENVAALGQEIVFGLKTVESLGFEELNKRRGKLETLESITLEKQAVAFCGDLSGLPELSGVKYLDMSYNLLVDMEEVMKIVEKMPLLESLNVNGNVFTVFGEGKLAVDTVSAASCGLDEARLDQFLVLFPKLRKLCVAGNNLASVPETALQHVDLLDLSFNRLQGIPNIPARELILANNAIETLPQTTLPTKVLDLRENKISDWAQVELISSVFPELEELRIDGCSMFENMEVEEMTTQLIGRLRCLTSGNGIKKLNGSTLLDDEIRSSEIYLVSLIQKGTVVLSTRMSELQEKYNIHQSDATQAHGSKGHYVITVKGPQGTLFSRTFLPSNSVLRLKGIITKHTSVPVHRFSLYYYPNDALHGSKTYLDDDVATLASAGLENQHHVFYEPLPL